MDSGIIVALVMTVLVVGFVIWVRLHGQHESNSETKQPKGGEHNKQ